MVWKRGWRSVGRSAAVAALGVLAASALAACGDGAGEGEGARDPGTAMVEADTQVVTVADAGLQTPESVLHDAEADVYLVSNINGQPLGKDDNGFIARIRPDGTVDALRWIDGASEGVTLHAPKGMALKGDTLFVSDIDSVRAFHRTTGEPLGARGVPDAAFLNDLAVADGVLYVSDTGVDASFSPTGAAAIYRFGADGQAEAVAQGEELNGPNGISVEGDAMLVVPFGAAEVRRVPLPGGGTGEVVATLPGGQLDGVERIGGGEYLVSSWENSAVYRVTANGEATALVEGVPSPADIGWDAERRRVLIPVFTEDRLEFHPVR